MVSAKGKRKIIYNDSVYYWYIRIKDKSHRINIISEDKKIHLEYPFFDTEIPVTPSLIKKYLDEFYDD